MNKVYRVIYNHATQTWTAVSELAKGRKKTKSEKTATVAVAAYLVLASGGAYAATQVVDGQLTRTNQNRGRVVLMDSGTGDQGVQIGSEVNMTGTEQAVAIGNNINIINSKGGIAIGGDDAGTTAELGNIAGINFINTAREAGGFTGAFRALKVEGRGAIGIGTMSVANGKGATAVGMGSTANVEGATSFGALAYSTGTGSSAFGLASRAEGSNTLALGAGARATQAGSIAIGAGSVTTAGVAVTSSGQKYQIAGTTYDPLTNINYDVNNVVSVGNTTVKRQIQNVAPGQITATSTDAINGSQLYAITAGVQQVINNHIQNINQNINNSGFHLKNNAGTTVADVNKDDSLTFKNGTFTTSNVTANREVSFDVVTQNIVVRNGSPINPTGAAGVATAQTVANVIRDSGFNLQANGQNGTLIKPGNTVSINSGDNTEVVKNGNTITVHAKSRTISASTDFELSETTPDVHQNNTHIELSDAIKNQINQGVAAKAATDKGFNVTSDSGVLISRQLGDTVTITGGNGTGSFTASNVKTVNTATGVQVQFSENPNFSTITTAGTASIGGMLNANGGLNVAGGQTVNFNNNTLINVGSGGNTDTNAANIADVKRLAAAADTTASTSGTNGIEVVKTTVNGKTTDYQVGLTQEIQDEIAKGQTALNAINTGIYTFDGDDNTTTGEAPTGNISFVGGDNINTIADAKNGTPTVTINLDRDIVVDNVTVGTVTISQNEGINAGDKVITGVKDATKANEAVNLGQLNATKVSLKEGKNIASIDKSVTADGTTYTINAKDTSATVSTVNDKAIKVTPGTAQDGITDFAIDLGDDTKASLAKANTAVQTVNGQDGITANKQGDTVTVGLDEATKANLTKANTAVQTVTGSNGITASKTADGYHVELDETTKANLNKADTAVQEIKTTVNGQAVKTLSQADNTQEFTDGKNIAITTQDGKIIVATQDNVTFTDVKTDTLTTTGTATIGGMLNVNGGLTVAAGQTVNMGDNRIQNVADGTADKDAVNVSQLRNNVTNLNQNIETAKTELTTKGLDFTGNTGETHRNLGTKLAITGTGSTQGDYSGANLKTAVTETGVALLFADNPAFKDITATSIKTGDNVLNNAGLTIGTASITNANGINAGNKTIQGVANGVNANDAVNLSQLNAAKVDIVQGANITSINKTVTDNGTTYTINAKDTSATVSTVNDKAIKVTPGTAQDGITDFAIDLGDDTKASLAKANTAVQTVNGQDGITANKQGDTVTVGLDEATKANLTKANTAVQTVTGSNGITASKTADGYHVELDETTKANLNKADTAVQEIKTTVNGQAVKTLSQADNTQEFTDGKNIAITTQDGKIIVATQDNVTFTDVKTDTLTTTGTATIGGMLNVNGGLTVAAGQTVNMGDNRIQNVADGTADKDAVNVSQLRNNVTNLNQNIETAKTELTTKGLDFTGNTGETHRNLGTKLAITGTGSTQGDYSGANLKTAVTETGVALLFADNPAFKDITATSIKTGDNVLNNAGLTIGTASITNANGINAGNKTIQGVANGVNANDAVNLSQLNAAKVDIVQGANITSINKTVTDNGTTYTINAKDTSATVSTVNDKAIKVTPGTAQDGITDFAIDLGDDTKASLAKANTAVQTVNGQDGITANKQGDTVTVGLDEATKANLTKANTAVQTVTGSNGITASKTADGYHVELDETTKANLNKADTAVQEIKTTVNGQAVKTLSQADNTQEFTDGKNIAITTQDGKIIVATQDNVTFTDVKTDTLTTTGTATIGGMLNVNGGLTVAAGQTVNMGDNRIQNVADGTADKDAVNVSQLRNNVTNLNQNIETAKTELTTKGLDFTGNTGETHRNLGTKLAITGTGSTQGDYSGANLKTAVTETGVALLFADNPAFKDITATSIKTGDNVLNNAGLTIGTASITNANGINAGNKTIQGVANGVNANDAVNLSQLNAAKVDIVQGANITSINKTVTDNGTTYTINAKDTSATVSTVNDKAIKVTPGTAQDGITDFAIDLGDDTKASLAKANTAVQTVNGQDGITANKQGDTVTVGLDEATKANLTKANTAVQTVTGSNGITASKTADGYHVELDETTKANLNKADTAVQEIKTTVNGQAVKTLSQADNTQEFTDGKNIAITTQDGKIIVATQDNVTFTDVKTDTLTTTGTATIGGMLNVNGGLTVAAGQTVNMGDNRIQNVADGTADKDAVNVSQLRNNVTNLNQNIETAKTELTTKGLDFTGNTGETHRNLGTKLAITGTGSTQGDYSGANLKTAVTETGVALLFADNPAFKDITATSIKTGDNVLNNAGLTIGTASITNANGINAGNKTIQGVANGVNANDAVNLSQLNAAKVDIVQGANITSINKTVTDNGTTYTINAKDTSATVSTVNDKAIKVTPGTAQDGITDFAIDLGDDTKASLAKANTAVQTVNGQDGITANKQGDTVTVGLDEATKANLTKANTAVQTVTGSNGITASKTADGYHVELDETTKANLNKADTAVQEIKTTVNGQAVKTLSQADNTQEFTDGKNIAITTQDGKIIVATQDNVTFTDVKTDTLTTTGTATIGGMLNVNGGLTVAAGQTVNMGDNRIQNVADGTADKDAVNVSQLRNNVTNLNQNIETAKTELTTKGLDFTGNTGETHRNLGTKLAITGTGSTQGDYSGANLKTAVTETGVALLFADNPAFKDITATSIKTGDNVLNNAGLTIGTASITNANGINAGNKTIQGVANGVNANDAVNLSQLNAAKVDIVQGANITSINKTVTDNGTTYTINAKDTSATVSTVNDKAIKVTPGTAQDGITDFAIDLGDDTKASLAKANTAVQTVNGQDGITANKQGDTVTVGLDEATKANLTKANTAVQTVTGSNGITASKTADGYHVELDETTKANLNKADTAVQEIKTTVNGQAVKTLSQADNTQEFTDGKNIAITTQDGKIIVATQDNVTFTDVKTDTLTTTGTATIGGMLNVNGGLTVAAGQTVNMGDNRIQNVADGTADKDAVNVSQLRNNVTNLNQNIETAKTELTTKGLDFTGNTGETHRNLGTKLAITGTGSTQGDYSGANLKTAVTETGVALLFADNPAFKDITATSIKTGDNVLNNAGLTIGTASITNANGINAGNKTIQGVANGVNANDAVNLSQLNAAKVDIVQGANITSINKTVTDNGTTYTINAKDTSATVSTVNDKAIKVTPGTAQDGITDFAIDLGDDTKASLAKANTAVQTVNGQDGITANKQGDTVTVGLDEATKANLTKANTAVQTVTGSNGITASKTADGYHVELDETTKANLNKADTAVQEIKTTVNGQAVKTLSQADNSQDFVDGDNIAISSENGAIKVATKKDVNFDNVQTATLSTTGNATIGGTLTANGGLEVANGQTVNMGNNRIQGVANGVADTDAVNVAQLNNATKNLTDKVNNAGWTVKANGDDGQKVANNGTVNFVQGNNIAIERTGTDITVKTVDNPTFTQVQAQSVNATTVNADAVNAKAVQADSVQTTGNVTVGGTLTANGGLTVAVGQPIDMGGNAVNGVAPAEISPSSTQAVNGAQIYELQQGINRANAQLNDRITGIEESAYGGTASAIATGLLPQAFNPGESLGGVAIGTYKGASAVAVGFSSISDNGKYIFRLAGGATSTGDYSGGAAIGVKFR